MKQKINEAKDQINFVALGKKGVGSRLQCKNTKSAVAEMSQRKWGGRDE